MPIAHLATREIDIHSEDHIRRIVMEIDGEQNRKRRRLAWKANQCLEGNQKEFVKKEIARLYPHTHQNFRIGDISIVKKVNDKQSKSYKSPPIRKAGTDKETVSLNDLYRKFHFSRAFKEFDSIFNLHKYAALWLAHQNPEDTTNNEFKYILNALAPYEFDMVRDQVSGEPIIFILNYPDNDVTRQSGLSDGQEQTISESQSDTAANTKIYSMWSRDKFAKVQIKRARGHGNEPKDQMTVTFQKKSKNLIGRLPLAYLQKGNSVDYPVPNNLAEQSIDWNVGFSDLKTAATTQGHGQLVISHPEKQVMKQIHMGMHTALSLPQSKKVDEKPTTAQYISASPNLAGQLDVLKFDIGMILDDHNIKSQGNISGGAEKFASGFDRLVSEADVSSLIADNQGTYADETEPEVFLILKSTEKAMNQTTFNGTETIEVHFEKPKVLISDTETLANIEKREELGTLLPHEKHIILNPNLTEEQAIEREEKIQEAKEAKMKTMLGTPSTEEDEDPDDPPKPAEEE